MSLNLAQCLRLTAEQYPDKRAVILDDFSLTYRELQALVNRIANVLRDKGIRHGDKVALMLPNTPLFTAVYYAILTVGAAAVPVNVLLRGAEIQYYLEDSDAKLFLAWKGFYADAQRAFAASDTCHHLLVVAPSSDHEQPPEGELLMPLLLEESGESDYVDTMPDDTAVLLYTSGTTGHPKGAELTHFNMFFNALYTAERIFHATPEDVLLAVLPLFHSFGQTCIMNAGILAGGTITMMTKFAMPRVLEVIQRDRVSIIAAVPTMYFYMLDETARAAYDVSSVRMAISGGAALPVEVLKAFEERYEVPILEGYGLSETSPVASFNVVEKPRKPGSIGLPIWGCQMEIMCDDGSFADTGEVGEIVIRGHNVMKGYYKRPVATEEAIVNGWFHTGDLARKDEDGYFFIVDRKKDLIIRSGMNVYPREIEEVLYGHPAVQEAAVVGIPDRIRGETVKAFVALRAGMAATAEELSAYCAVRLAKFKVPSEVEILPALPKGPTGKILKRDLRGE